MSKKSLLGLVCIVSISHLSTFACARQITPQKKIIYGAATTSALTLASDINRMEQMAAFDGTCIYPPARKPEGQPKRSLGHPFRAGIRLSVEEFQPEIDALRSMKPRQYRDNFLWLYTVPGKKHAEVADWFDPEFDAVINNWKVIAQFCKRAGLTGVILDEEAYYGTLLFDYGKFPAYTHNRSIKYVDSKSAQEYADQVFKRGAQIMRAINSAYPDIKILVLHGPSDRMRKHMHGKNGGVTGNLILAFMDGLLSECTGNAQIIDGNESAYGLRAEVSYADKRRTSERFFRLHSRVPDKLDKHFRIAMAALLGPEYTMPFTEDVQRNYYTPAEFEYALHQALKYSDEYVWVYTTRGWWWDKSPKGGIAIPQGYRDALVGAHAEDVPRPVLRNLDGERISVPGSKALPRRAGPQIPGKRKYRIESYDEKATFGDLWVDHTLLADMGNLWRFRIDPNNIGKKQRWCASEVPQRLWTWITSELPWDSQGYRLYDGYGWYRQEFKAPIIRHGKKVYLAFGAVAHEAEVYLNGKFVGEHKEQDSLVTLHGREGWKERFLIDVSAHIQSGKNNLLAVRVLDHGSWAGGIWKPVKLIAKK